MAIMNVKISGHTLTDTHTNTILLKTKISGHALSDTPVTG